MTDDDDQAGGPQGGAGLRNRWSSLLRGSEKVVAGLAVSVKDVRRSAVIKHGVEARDRGNLEAAFWLFREAHAADSENVETAGHFWDAAVALTRAGDALSAARLLIRKHADAEQRELAIQYWAELIGHVPDALVEASVLSKLIRILQQKTEAETDPQAKALRQHVLLKAVWAVVDERNEGLNPGLAFRVAEAVRSIDSTSAVRAARIALEADSLHDAKRALLMQIIDEAADAPPGASAASAAKPRDDEAGQRAIDAGPTTPRSAPEQVAERVGDAARNHPLRTDGPSHPGLSEEEIADLQMRLPPIVPDPPPVGPDVSLSSDTPGGPLDEAPQLEVDPDEVSQPDIETDFDAVPPSQSVEWADSDEPVVSSEPIVSGESIAGDFLDSAEPIDPSESIDGDELQAVVDSVEEVLQDCEPADGVAEAHDEADSEFGEFGEFDASDGPKPIDVPICEPRFADLKTIEAELIALETDQMVLSVGADKPAHVLYERIAAIAVVEVAEAPGLLVDLLLNWHSDAGDPLRSLRLRFDHLECIAVTDAEAAEMTALDFLAEILDKSRAAALPSLDAVLGIRIERFDSVEAYERDVLHVAR